MTNPNDPAFPQEEPIAFTTKQIHEKYPEISSAIGVTTQIAKGLTKREEFAKAAMQGIVSYERTFNIFTKPSEQKEWRESRCPEIATLSLEMADALIAALNKASEGSGGE